MQRSLNSIENLFFEVLRQVKQIILQWRDKEVPCARLLGLMKNYKQFKYFIYWYWSFLVGCLEALKSGARRVRIRVASLLKHEKKATCDKGEEERALQMTAETFSERVGDVPQNVVEKHGNDRKQWRTLGLFCSTHVTNDGKHLLGDTNIERETLNKWIKKSVKFLQRSSP